MGAALQGMREMMRMSLARSLRTLAEEDRLAAALPVVCGSAMAAQCTVAGLDAERVVHLCVREAWMEPVLSMREVLRHDLQRVSGVPLAGLRLQAEDGAPRKLPARVLEERRMSPQRRVGR